MQVFMRFRVPGNVGLCLTNGLVVHFWFTKKSLLTLLGPSGHPSGDPRLSISPMPIAVSPGSLDYVHFKKVTSRILGIVPIVPHVV